MKNKENNTFLFGKKNFLFMGIGVLCIALGFLFMTGSDANTQPDGVFNPDYWNEGIFSWRRLRLSPFLIITGFVIEVYGILLRPKSL